jgi:hypothetical protein
MIRVERSGMDQVVGERVQVIRDLDPVGREVNSGIGVCGTPSRANYQETFL